MVTRRITKELITRIAKELVTRRVNTNLFTILNDCETRVGGGEVGGVDLSYNWKPVHKPASPPEKTHRLSRVYSQKVILMMGD